jgi:hypothetical protein
VKLETRDLAALILATGVAVAVIVLAIGAVVHSNAISISEATLLGTVLGAVAGSLATFLGFRAGRDTNGTSEIPEHIHQGWGVPASPPTPPARPSPQS